MEKYRIKIETEKSGKKWYTGQVQFHWIIKFGWSDIGDDGNTGDYCGVTKQRGIGDAEKAIMNRIQLNKKLDGETIISIEYKDYEGN